MFGAKGAYIMICGKNQNTPNLPSFAWTVGHSKHLRSTLFSFFLTKGNIYNNLTITMACSGKNLIHCGQCFCTQSTVHTRAEPACSAFLTFFFAKFMIYAPVALNPSI